MGRLFARRGFIKGTAIILGSGAAVSLYLDRQWRTFDIENKQSNMNPAVAGYLGDSLKGYKTTAYNNPPMTLKESVAQYPPLSSSTAPTHGVDSTAQSSSSSIRVADVCVVGAGFAGLHTALTLAEKNVNNIVILESNRVGSGASGMCGGMAIVGYEAELGILQATVGVDNARKIFQQSVDGYERLKATIRKYKINCGMVEEGILEMMLASRFAPTKTPTGAIQLDQALVKEEMEETETECSEEEHLFGQITKVMPLQDVANQKGLSSDRFAYGCYNPRTFSMNPLALTMGLARACVSTGKVSIHERSEVISMKRETPAEAMKRLEARIEDYRGRVAAAPSPVVASEKLLIEEEITRVASTINKYKAGDFIVKTSDGGTLIAKEVLLATNYAPWRLRPKLSMTTTPCSTSIFLTKPLPEAELQKVFRYKGCVIDERFGLVYFRRVEGNRVLFGGLASAIPFASNMPKAADSLKSEFIRTFPSLAPYLEVQEHWEGRIEHRDTMFPVVGRDEVDGLWYSLGFSGHGVVPTCTSGEVVGSAIASVTAPTSATVAAKPGAEGYKLKMAELLAATSNPSSSSLLINDMISIVAKDPTNEKALFEPTDTRYELWKEVSWLASAGKIKSLEGKDGGPAPFHQYSAGSNAVPVVSTYMPPVMPPSGFPLSSIVPYLFVDYCLPLWEWWQGAV